MTSNYVILRNTVINTVTLIVEICVITKKINYNYITKFHKVVFNLHTQEPEALCFFFFSTLFVPLHKVLP